MRLYQGEQEGHQSITSETGEGSFYCTAGGCIPVGACTFGAEGLMVSSGLCPSVPGLCLHRSGGVRQLIGFIIRVALHELNGAHHLPPKAAPSRRSIFNSICLIRGLYRDSSLRSE